MGSICTDLRRCLPAMHLDPYLDKFPNLDLPCGFHLRCVGCAHEHHFLCHPSRQLLRLQVPEMDHLSHYSILRVHVDCGTDTEEHYVRLHMPDDQVGSALAIDYGRHRGCFSHYCAAAVLEKYKALTQQ